VLGTVACHVLLAVGAHDPVTRPEWGREIAAALPPERAELHVFEGSSHVIAADEPDGLLRISERFIAAL
jgi:pimeloyl-ACP methyl ester carboxylesterase